MSVAVRKLNDDTSFLFTFTHGQGDCNNTAPGFRVLIDPWLIGDSSWLHPAFQQSSHTIAPSIESLADLQDEIDIIVISQDKPDHCHRETLCSWPKEKPIAIFATAVAAKKIRGWNHFDERAIHVMPAYSPNNPETLKTVRAVRGIEELTIASLESKKDLTGLHNAIAMTYHPDPVVTYPGSQELFETRLMTPPASPRTSRSHDLQPQTLRTRIKSYSSLRSIARRPHTPVASPPLTPDDRPYVSCIYTPHGVSTSLVEPYVQHLSTVRALPLTLLVHSMTMEKNPWFMGGVVAAGAPGGLDIVKLLQGRVKYWLSAHDEEKDNKGLSVKLLKTQKFETQEVQLLLRDQGFGRIKVATLNSGEQVTIND